MMGKVRRRFLRCYNSHDYLAGNGNPLFDPVCPDTRTGPNDDIDDDWGRSRC